MISNTKHTNTNIFVHQSTFIKVFLLIEIVCHLFITKYRSFLDSFYDLSVTLYRPLNIIVTIKNSTPP